MSNFLEIDESILKNRLLFQEGTELESLNVPTAGEWTRPQEAEVITPLPGICVKLKSENDQKIFLNIVHSPKIAAPDDLEDSELIKLIESDDVSNYKIPMSMLDPHTEKDKSNNPCTAYDILINSEYFDKIERKELFQTFFIIICLEGIEEKYSQSLDKNKWVILKNKKYLGTKIPNHHIRNRLISEVGAKSCFSEKVEDNKPIPDKPLISEIETKKSLHEVQKDVKYQIVKLGKSGDASWLAGEFWLPEVYNASDIVLLVGPDRIVVEGKGRKCDLFFPYTLVPEVCQSSFEVSRNMLTVRVMLES